MIRISKYLLSGILFLLLACGSPDEPAEEYVNIQGPTMGTIYQLKYQPHDNSVYDMQAKVDSLLEAFNAEVSTYIETSVISRFNRSNDTFIFNKERNPHFYKNLSASFELYHMTDGFFDPTVMPLVNYWGFGYEPRDTALMVDSAFVYSLKNSVGLNKLHIEEVEDSVILVKTVEGIKLDFSAIAKGDGVDLIASYLENAGIEHFLVDIGGEIFSKGSNPAGEDWVIGINQPAEDAMITDIIKKIRVSGRGLATSGNYRNFYKVGENVYSHTINPKTGFTERNNMLSASIISENCMKADALATASMTMGEERVKKMAPDWEKTAVFIVYQENGEVKSWSTKEFNHYIKD